jgi:hypothetical protein
VTGTRLELTRAQILAFRRHAGALDERLPSGPHALRRAAWAGLQDSMPRAALLSIHARVRGTQPTTLQDPTFSATDQRRYVEPLTVASAVIPSSGVLRPFGVVPGTLGVAFRKQKGIAVPFIVSDLGPRIGEGSPALARRLAGLMPKPELTRAERFQGQVDTADVTWVFFGGPKLPPPYTASAVEAAAKAAFDAWGGLARLQACAAR